MALAGRARNDDSVRAVQNQSVNITVQHNPTTTTTSTSTTTSNASTPSPASVILTTPSVPSTSSFQEPSNEVIERDIKLEPIDEPIDANANDNDNNVHDFYEEVDNLHAIVNNYETVAKALILIIELLQSNPLKLNKIIIPTEVAFKELITILTNADDVEIRYSEDIACGISSKKYRIIEDIIVIKHQEPKSLKYSHPDIIRLFDRFNISVKMLAKKT